MNATLQLASPAVFVHCCNPANSAGRLEPGRGDRFRELFSGVDVNAYSFTAGADYPGYAATMTGFSDCCAGTVTGLVASDGTALLEIEDGAIGNPPGPTAPSDFFLCVDLGSPIPEMEPTNEVAPHAPRSNGLRDRVVGAATAKNGIFAITVNGDTIGVIGPVGLERGAPEWKVNAGSGGFAGSFIITL